MTKITKGVIKESYNFCMDGENIRGSNTYNCKVVKYWGKTKNFLPKEVVCEDNIHYRETTKNGWRRYNKDSKTKFRSKCYKIAAICTLTFLYLYVLSIKIYLCLKSG